MVTSNQPLVLCKRCGKKAPADSFVLDHLHKMIVCPDCAKERRSSKGTVTPVAQEEKKEPAKPAGWDSEDEYLEKFYKQKRILGSLNFEKIDYDSGMYTCPKCREKFVYNIPKRYPGACPNCGNKVEVRL